MTKLDMLKAAGGFVVSVGVGAIVGNAVKATTPANVGFIKAICIGAGSFALSNMVSDQATKYTENKIDDTVTQLKEMITTEK